MNTFNQELLYVRRNDEGDIVEVFEGNPSKYYLLHDRALKVPLNASDGGGDCDRNIRTDVTKR